MRCPCGTIGTPPAKSEILPPPLTGEARSAPHKFPLKGGCPQDRGFTKAAGLNAVAEVPQGRFTGSLRASDRCHWRGNPFPRYIAVSSFARTGGVPPHQRPLCVKGAVSFADWGIVPGIDLICKAGDYSRVNEPLYTGQRPSGTRSFFS